MSKRVKKKGKPGRGALFILGLLFFASGIIRLADGTGLALAREVELLTSRVPSDASAASAAIRECKSLDDIGAAVKALRERSTALDDREKQIEYRMAALTKTEHEIEQDLAALIEAEDALAATIALADGAAERDIAGLIAVYEQMKPKDAAAMFDAMDPTFAAGFIARLRPETAAAVLAGLTPNKAYVVSAILAGRNSEVPTE